jgi:hypothetical protein
MKLASKNQIRGARIQSNPSNQFFRLQTRLLPSLLPLLLGPIIVWECDPKSRVTHPIHETQTLGSSKPVPKVILEQQPATSYAASFKQKHHRVVRVMENIGKEDGIE